MYIDENGLAEFTRKMKTYIDSKFAPEPANVLYGVKIDLADSNPETSVTYTDDAVGFNKSYMDFANDKFEYGSWADKFPFNQVKPCLFKDGAVVTYLNPDNYAQDTDGNAVDITGADGDVMIEIPKVYYKLSKDSEYQYIQISNAMFEGACCLAHTYKGIEKDKVYIGAYQSYYDGSKSRSISGVSATGSVSLNTWRTYAHNQGAGYENFYWNLLVLLQALFVIQFKNLDSQSAMGYGFCNASRQFTTGGALNTKGMNYCASGTSNAQMKWLGIEDFWGSRTTWIDGAYISIAELTVADVTSESMAYNGTGAHYINVGNISIGGSFPSGYLKQVVSSNLGGFCPLIGDGSSSTYYCDMCYVSSGYILNYGGYYSSRVNGGAFNMNFGNNADNAVVSRSGRLAFCG